MTQYIESVLFLVCLTHNPNIASLAPGLTNVLQCLRARHFTGLAPVTHSCWLSIGLNFAFSQTEGLGEIEAVTALKHTFANSVLHVSSHTLMPNSATQAHAASLTA